MKTVFKGYRKLIGAFMGGLLLLGPVLPVQAAESSPYYGITIDGDFSDWESVQKYPGALGINEVAFVFDGDYVYVYIDEPTQAFSATWSGSHSNGKFTLKTDLGYETLFQLTSQDGGSVLGVEGALCAHSDTTWGLPGYYWEIAIPVSNLKQYNSTISFGHYLCEPLYVQDVANISGGGTGGDTGESGGTQSGDLSNPQGYFDGIVYDGNYDDWSYYPHDVLQYKTAGTHANVPDAEGALYATNGILFGHVVTYLQEHLKQGGGEFTQGMSVLLNDSWSTGFFPQLVTVDALGNINYNPTLSGLAQGTYEFIMIDATGWKSATNVSQWTNPADINYGTNGVYGKMMITIGPSKHDMEYWIDLERLTKKFNMDVDAAKVISAQYSRIGQKQVRTAGTSTGPLVGLALCASVAGYGVLCKKRSKVGKAV